MKSGSLFILLFTLIASCSNHKKIALQQLDPSIVQRIDWNALEARAYKQHTPVRLTIHHEGTRLEKTDDAAKKLRAIQKWGMGTDRNWTDIPYHFLIAPNGTIYEGRNVFTVGETNTEYDPTGHLLISCLGNLNEQEMPKEQLESLIKLTAYCCKKYKLPIETIASHRDHSTQTTCPGKNLYQYLENGYIKREVGKIVESE